MKLLRCGLPFALLIASTCAADDRESGSAESATYLRRAGEQYVRETRIGVRRSDDGREVRSATRRGELTLSIAARYDAEDRLLTARVTVNDGKNKRSATAVPEDDGRVLVRRDEGKPWTFDCPPGVIVTSAPDWTDACLAVRRYDPQGDQAQQFAGLWLHPVRDPQRLTFTVTRLGQEAVQREGREASLWRLRVELRGGSRYVGWRNAAGQLVRLAPEGKPQAAIVLAGWEVATAGLVP